MSISRRRTRGNSRATMPSLSTTTMNTDITNTAVYLPSIEESLQDWLTRSIPDTPSSSVSWLLNKCRCCDQVECENLEMLSSAIRKLEADSRLAAEIGQSLLHKHEQYVAESDEIKNGLEQEVEQLQNKVQELEQSLSDADAVKQDLVQEKDKSVWEWQKTRKVLDETANDLETSNLRCLQLGSELKAKLQELEKLRIFKFMARQADIREDTLRSKLEDIKQELAVSRKTELMVESKYKNLKAKYESMCFSFDKLKMDQQEMGITKDHQLDLVWLKESNEKLRKDVLKLTSALLVPNSADDLHMTSSTNNNNGLIELIKELASANNKLKGDLLDCSDLLLECRNDLYTKINQNQSEETMQNDDTYILDDNNKCFSASAPQSNEESMMNTVPTRLLNSTFDQQDVNETGVTVAQHDIAELSKTNKSKSIATPQPSLSTPTTEVPPAIVHHHYHYYMKQQKLKAEREKMAKNKRQSSEGLVLASTEDEENNALVPPTSLSEKPVLPDSSSPFHQLYNQVTIVLQRLQQTDIRALNRRLRRAFDIFELSGMSNSIIENIVTDVDSLRTQFLWIEDNNSIVKEEPWIHDIAMFDFFPIIELVQDMLKEIGQLRTTMNDLQVEYVKKVEESDVRLEKELLKKQQLQQEQLLIKQQQNQSRNGYHDNNRVTLTSWFSSVFKNKSNEKPVTKDSQPPASIRFAINNHSDISVSTTHSSIHPLSIPSSSTIHPTTSTSLLRHKKSDVERYGPPSSFPTRTQSIAIGNERTKRRSNATSNSVISSSPSFNIGAMANTKPFPVTMRASQSAGTVRRSKSMQAPALEYVIRRKRSTLGLGSSTTTDYNMLISPQSTPSDIANTFATNFSPINSFRYG